MVKYIRIKHHQNSSSVCCCYRNNYSGGQLAVISVNCKFVTVVVCYLRKDTDGRFFYNCSLCSTLASGRITIPEEKYFPHSPIKTPFVLLGIEVFPLIEYLMRLLQ